MATTIPIKIGSLPKLTRVLASILAMGEVLNLGSPAARAQDITVHTDKVANTINPFIYGHFFEHIYNGGDNGLWGEMVWNRSFEYVGDDAGKWESRRDGADKTVAQTASTEGAKLLFGDPQWSDCELTLQARKLSGNEGFLILLRANDQGYLWANIAGWGNSQHQLQYIGQPRNSDIGPRVPGRVESNRWYSIRVRSEGRHIETFLDGAKILDNTIPEELNRPGQLGIGAWLTANEFKNFKVTDLQGKVLFEGTPEIPTTTTGAGRHWDARAANAHVVTQDAFNDEHALHVVGSTGGYSRFVEQAHFCFRKGETYKGSLFMKTARPARSVPPPSIRCYEREPTMSNLEIANIELPAPTDQWKRYPFEFVCNQDAFDASLQIRFAEYSDLLIDQFSLMSESSIKNDGFRPDIYQAFADLKPTIIRWPGGCYAEQYHWKNGIGPQSARRKNLQPMWNDYDPNALGTDEYITLCRKVGAEPLLVINTGMHVTGTKNAAEWLPWIQEACDWVEYCNGPVTSKWGAERAKNGHAEPYHVKYWEIDNELWRSLQPNPAVYAQAVPLFAAAMKKIDPAITIIAHGGNGADRRYDRMLLNNAAPAFDILSIHHYMDANRFAGGVAEQDSLYNDVAGLIKSSQNPGIKMYVSEWNAQTTNWRTGLYAAGLLNTFEKYGENLTMAGPALLFRHTSARDWDNAFINFDHKGWFPAPNYVVMKLWREHFAPDRLVVDGLTGAPGSELNLIATRATDDKTIILKAVNATNAAIPVVATFDPSGGFRPGSAACELLAPGSLSARNTMDKPDAIKHAPSPVLINNQTVSFNMPPYSAGVITVTRGK